MPRGRQPARLVPSESPHNLPAPAPVGAAAGPHLPRHARDVDEERESCAHAGLLVGVDCLVGLGVGFGTQELLGRLLLFGSERGGGGAGGGGGGGGLGGAGLRLGEALAVGSRFRWRGGRGGLCVDDAGEAYEFFYEEARGGKRAEVFESVLLFSLSGRESMAARIVVLAEQWKRAECLLSLSSSSLRSSKTHAQ